VPDDTNDVVDVYVLDRLDGGLERVSVSSAGAQSDSGCDGVSISADGRRVAFASRATNLVDGDSNGQYDVFVHDRVTGTTIRASVGPGGVQGSGPSAYPDLSASGTRVAFQSRAFELVPDDANGVYDVFVRDLEAGTTTRVSVSSTGGEGDALSRIPAISGDGNVVAFESQATNLVTGDVNASIDVFVHDLTTGATERVTVSSTGGEANKAASGAHLSLDGRFVSFVSSATNLAPSATTTVGKAFVRDRQAHTTTWAFVSTSTTISVDAVDLSGDGRYLTGDLSNGASFVRDRFADRISVISSDTGPDVYYPKLSANGRYIVVQSTGAVAPMPPGASGQQAFVIPNPL
jgi:hypothetical protein